MGRDNVCENLEKEKGSSLSWSPGDTIIPGCLIMQSRGVSRRGSVLKTFTHRMFITQDVTIFDKLV